MVMTLNDGKEKVYEGELNFMRLKDFKNGSVWFTIPINEVKKNHSIDNAIGEFNDKGKFIIHGYCYPYCVSDGKWQTLKDAFEHNNVYIPVEKLKELVETEFAAA